VGLQLHIGVHPVIVGGLASFGVIGLAYMTHFGVWAALGCVGCFLNLFNLLPVTPLDGGRVMTAVSRWMNLVGLLLLFGYIGVTVFWLHNPYSLPILAIIALVGAIELFGRFRRKRYSPQYFDIPLWIRVMIASAWVVLLGVLSYGVLLSITQLAALHQIAKI
jgi:membrane-associated protease RseP (regulator of RpoE activity)